MLSARVRLVLLWFSLAARTLLDAFLWLIVLSLWVPSVFATGRKEPVVPAPWYLASLWLIAPFIVLAPLHGALCSSLPRRWLLVGSLAFSLGLFILPFCADEKTQLLLGCLSLSLTGVGAAIYSTARQAMLPAAAHDARWSLSRINGFMQTASAFAFVSVFVMLFDPPSDVYEGTAGTLMGGLVLVTLIRPVTWLNPQPAAFPMLWAIALVVALITALPAAFASDRSRPVPPGPAFAGFFRVMASIRRQRDARRSLLALACFLALATAGVFVVLDATCDLRVPGNNYLFEKEMVWSALGLAGGSLLAALQGHLLRGLGLVPVAVTGLLIALLWAALAVSSSWPCLLLGVMAGLLSVPLRAHYQAVVSADERGHAMALMNMICGAIAAALTGTMIGLLNLKGQLLFLAGLAAIGTVLAWRTFFRPAFELAVEILMWPFYRIRGYGPGLYSFPAHGPTLVVANHSSWLDPAWLAKVVPRKLTPMMTSLFWDRPINHWLMTRVFHGIRVEDSQFRREAPELAEAVAALDRGECVLVFPEGAMRRRPDQLLRRFGQGVWHILHERPATPVVVCWIEGGFGSFFSYKDGPPMVNKRLDWWRPIRIAFGAPQLLDPALLEDRQATRAYLMRLCVSVRPYLGLSPQPPPLPPPAPSLTTDEPKEA